MLSNTTKDVHDAAQVPPSVFAAHQGEPEVLHDGARGSSAVTDQEKYLGSGGGL
jgi:hypothetical protein